MILFKGGDVLTDQGRRPSDVLVADGAVADVGSIDPGPRMTVIDATGAVVGPGFVDLHVHLREPGQMWKEDVESGGRAAVAGGYTAVVAMPNTEPPIDSPKVARMVLAAADEARLVTVLVAGALTKGRDGLAPADVFGLYELGVRMFSDDGDSVADEGLLEALMRTIATLPGAFVSEHAEDASMTSDGHIHEGLQSERHGLGGLPAAAEERIVARDIELSKRTRCALHLQHLSSAGSVELVRRAKATGLHLTCEVTPHHLAFDDRDLETLDGNLKMYPPIRGEQDRVSLIGALRDGTIDAVASDHAPHSREEKDVSFREAPRGVIGLETAASVAFEALEGDLDRFFDRMSHAPARIAGLKRHGGAVAPGGPANLVLWSPGETWVPTCFESKSANSPFLGRELQGRVLATVHEGELVYWEGAVNA